MGQELTKSDVEKIQAEIDHRKLVLRPQITKEIAEAAAQGDRSENFEYYAAKKANRENNGRINYLYEHSDIKDAILEAVKKVI